MSNVLNRRLDKILAADEPELGLGARLEAARRRIEAEGPAVWTERRLKEYEARIAAGEELDEMEARLYRACQRMAKDDQEEAARKAAETAP